MCVCMCDLTHKDQALCTRVLVSTKMAQISKHMICLNVHIYNKFCRKYRTAAKTYLYIDYSLICSTKYLGQVCYEDKKIGEREKERDFVSVLF